jgi:hypothetical protein
MPNVAPTPTPGDILGESLLKRLLFIVAAYQLAALALIAVWSVQTWNGSDWKVIWVPQAVLEWSLIGAVAGALYKLSNYPKLTDQEKARLYLWVLAKPFVSTALGSIVYFIAVGGVLTLKGNADIDHPELLSAMAFFAAFSDRFALSVLDRLSFSITDREQAERQQADRQQVAQEALDKEVRDKEETKAGAIASSSNP